MEVERNCIVLHSKMKYCICIFDRLNPGQIESMYRGGDIYIQDALSLFLSNDAAHPFNV